jgi:hypothetical protein
MFHILERFEKGKASKKEKLQKNRAPGSGTIGAGKAQRFAIDRGRR